MANTPQKKRATRTKVIASIMAALCAVAIVVVVAPPVKAPTAPSAPSAATQQPGDTGATGGQPNGQASDQAGGQSGDQADLTQMVPSVIDSVENYESSDPEVQEMLHRADLGDNAAAYEPGTVLVSIEDGATPDQVVQRLNAIPELAGVSLAEDLGSYVRLKLPATISVEDALGAIAASGETGPAQPNFRYYIMNELTPQEEATAALQSVAAASSERLLQGTDLGNSLGVQAYTPPNDYDENAQWGLKSINAPGAWQELANTSTAETTVAVVDAGFLTDHNDIKGNVKAQYNAATGATTIKSSDSSTANRNHGTHCLGIVGAVSNNGTGIAGAVNNKCKVMPVQVADAGGHMYTSYVTNAYTYLVRNKSSNKVRVVSMSLGSASAGVVDKTTDEAMYNAIQNARNNGILTVVAACNANTKDGYGTAYQPPFYAYPSDFDNVVSVINLQKSDTSVTRSSLSNYNKGSQKAKNISAPGTSIYSLSGEGTSGYRYESGTSMATPMVAAVAGMMFASNSSLTPAEAESKLYSTAKDLGSAGWDIYYGYGEVDAQAAVAAGPYLSGNSSLTINGTSKGSTVLTVKVGGKSQSASAYNWSSSNTRVATVDANGRVTAVAAGQAVITATSKSDGAKAAQTMYVTQTNKPVSQLSISNLGSRTYNGYAHTPAPTVKDGSTTLTANRHYRVSYSNNINAGTATVTITGISPYYSGTVNKTFYISKAPLSKASISLSATSFTYDGKTKSPSVTVRDIGKNSGSNITGQCNVVSGKVVLGSGNVVVSAKSSCKNFSGSVTRSFSVTVKKITMHRLYNPNSGEHFYTASTAERDGLIRIGWQGEGVAWTAPSSSTVPVYRLYNPNNGDHHYTPSSAERNNLVGIGWKYEGISWYSYGASTSKPLYRLFNPNLQVGSHHYTTSVNERNNLVSIGWQAEGVGWYAA